MESLSSVTKIPANTVIAESIPMLPFLKDI